MVETSIGFSEDPPDAAGVVRSRTSQQIHAWDIPKTQKAIEVINDENGKLAMPGVYLLFVPRNKAYIGEAKSLYERVKQHIMTPEDKFRDWNKATLISDGRSASHSNFSDEAVRHEIEIYLIRLLKANKYQVLAQGQSQILNAGQKAFVEALIPELNYFLLKKNIIKELLGVKEEERIYEDAIKQALEHNGFSVGSVGAYEAVVNEQPAFIRPGSKKPKGWQITFRGRKPGSFIDCLQRGDGYLIVSRGGVLVIPLDEVRKVIVDKASFEQDTIDIWVKFGDGQVTLSYKDQTLDVTQYKLPK